MKIYQSNVQKYKETILSLQEASDRLSLLRLFTFIFSAVVITLLANERLVSLLIIVVPLCAVCFGFLITRHNTVDRDKRYTTFLKEINESESLRLENNLSGLPSGQSFTDRDHPYVSDLDIFGQHSIFQLINRTTTEYGQVLLAKWLSEPATKEVIIKRQEAVRELAPLLEWRQSFQASGMNFKHTQSDYTKLMKWTEKPGRLLTNQSRHLVVSIILSIASTSTAVYFLGHVLSIVLVEEIVPFLVPLIIILLINALVLRSVKPIVEDITENTLHNINILRGYQSLILKIESEKFNSEIPRQLQSTLRHQDYSAAVEIKKLSKVLEVLQTRGRKGELHNFFYTVFNVFWFLDVCLILLAEKWKIKNGSYLRGWAAVVSEFEVLSSIAGFYYSNPTFSFPEIKEEPYTINFKESGHPLIGSSNRVCNNLSLNGRGKIAMITGSNMAGKSTFLRTVGVNVVLALMGAPCCIKSGEVSIIQLFSSMRTQDNLEEGVSSFYAELKRVEQLLKLIESGQPLFFLLDEMFKGTNSKDRHKGGFSLIKQLEGLNTFGIISTHDLELANLAGQHKIVSNYSFNSGIQEGELTFSYHLTDGLCKDFNASELMKKSGIRILSQIEEA